MTVKTFLSVGWINPLSWPAALFHYFPVRWGGCRISNKKKALSRLQYRVARLHMPQRQTLPSSEKLCQESPQSTQAHKWKMSCTIAGAGRSFNLALDFCWCHSQTAWSKYFRKCDKMGVSVVSPEKAYLSLVFLVVLPRLESRIGVSKEVKSSVVSRCFSNSKRRKAVCHFKTLKEENSVALIQVWIYLCLRVKQRLWL